MRLNALELSKAYLDSSMHYSKISRFKDSEAKCHFLYGLIERVNGNYEVALKHLEKNITYFKKDSTNKAYALFQVAIIHRNLGDYKKSLETYLDILDIFEHKKDSSAMASTFNSIANIYGDMDNYDEAISNYIKANLIFINKDDKRNQANTFQNISEIFLRKRDTSSSRVYANQSLSIAQKINEDYAIGSAYYTLGRTYLSSNKTKTLDYYLKAKTYLEKINFKRRLVSLYNDLGVFYKMSNNTSQSVYYYNKALEILEETNDLLNIKNTYKGLSDNYALVNDYKKAYNFQSLFVTVKDSLFNEENVKSINVLQKQFETEKKNKEIVKQRLELEQQENEIKEKNSQMTLLYSVSLLLVLAVILIGLVYKQKHKRKKQELLTLKREYQIKSLESLIEGEEKERLRIAKELHDGVNGDLSAIKFKLSSLLETNNRVINEAIVMIDNSCAQVRAISHNLVPPSLENFNLVEATENYCHNLDAVNYQDITFQYIGDAIPLSKKAEVNAFRIIQELVTNALKHAEANEINVQISYRANVIQITVEDDGKGFDRETVKTDGIGLENIKSRIDYLNATLDFISNSKGTSYTIDIDLKALNDN